MANHISINVITYLESLSLSQVTPKLSFTKTTNN